jgi:site-specific DNA-methyltransferase (adenine-specific)
MKKFLNKIICADCIELLSQVNEPFVDLIFADPPFNIGYKYDKYHDKQKKKNYIAWTRDWMAACRNVLKPTGSFYIAIGDDYAANVKVIADELGLVMRNWIIWHYTFGQQTKTKFARAHTHIFYFVNDNKNFTFNDFAVRVPSDRQLIYNDKRANSLGKIPDDVWTQFPRVCGTFKERTRWHPCQMPESLLTRIIAVSSNPGDCVLDPFSGSGTTAAVAARTGRNYLGIEMSEDYVKNSRLRLAKAKKQRSQHNLVLNVTEMHEMKRLLRDIAIPAKKIAADKNLLTLLANQFTIRMNNHKQYKAGDLVIALEETDI